MKKKTLALIMAAAMVMGLAACGSSNSTTTTEDTTTEAAETETADAAETEDTSAEATEETADAAASDKVWVVATDTAFKPFEYTDDNGDFVGIDMDILDAVAKDQGFQYEVQVLGWDASIAACQAGQADGMIAGASITDERKESGWIFSDGYYDANQSMAVAAGSDIKGFEDLNGKSVAVKTASMSATYAESLADQYGFTVTYFEDSPTMYQDVILGNSAACVEDTPIMAVSIKEGDLDLKIPEGMESEGAPYGLAIMNADNQALLDMFNQGLANIKANGKYQEILDKYLK